MKPKWLRRSVLVLFVAFFIGTPLAIAAETAAALVIETATRLKLPVSTTHVISSTIMSVGLNRGPKAVNWGVIRNIGWAMLLTIPASATVSAIAWLVVKGLLMVFA
jgi:PiT family inorganic phosphate transporter